MSTLPPSNSVTLLVSTLSLVWWTPNTGVYAPSMTMGHKIVDYETYLQVWWACTINTLCVVLPLTSSDQARQA